MSLNRKALKKHCNATNAIATQNESEETELKNIEWAKKEIEGLETESSQNYPHDEMIEKEIVLSILDQLDEPEVLSQEWIDENSQSYYWHESMVPVSKLQNLLVPKQEEVDRAYKDGYEKGKQHTFYKGYLEGLGDKGNEPETVADVVTTFWKSYERLKEVMSMEVEELEE